MGLSVWRPAKNESGEGFLAENGIPKSEARRRRGNEMRTTFLKWQFAIPNDHWVSTATLFAYSSILVL